MQITSFTRLLARIERDLTPGQHIELRQRLDRRVTEPTLGARARAVRACRHGGLERPTQHGRDRLGRQRFRCRTKTSGDCGRTFNTLTGTPFAQMRKPEKWHGFAKALSNGFISVGRLDEMKPGLSRLTIWRWRNRFTQAQALH